jgi:hypothetical protein
MKLNKNACRYIKNLSLSRRKAIIYEITFTIMNNENIFEMQLSPETPRGGFVI